MYLAVSLQGPSLKHIAMLPLLKYDLTYQRPSGPLLILSPLYVELSERCADPDQRQGYWPTSSSIYPETSQSMVAAEALKGKALLMFHLASRC